MRACRREMLRSVSRTVLSSPRPIEYSSRARGTTVRFAWSSSMVSFHMKDGHFAHFPPEMNRPILSRVGGSGQQPPCSPEKRVVYKRPSRPNTGIVARRADAIGQQNAGNSGPGVAPKARPRETEVAERLGAGQRPGRRRALRLAVEAGAQGPTRTWFDQRLHGPAREPAAAT